MKTKQVKKKRSSFRRQEILNLAVQVFYEKGYHNASIKDVSTGLGTTKAAIYYHFHNKEEILYTVVDEMTNRLLLKLRSCISSYDDPIERLQALITSQISFIKTHKKELKILVEDKRFLTGELRRLTREKERTTFHIFRANMEELQKAGLLKSVDLTTATFGIFGMITWLYHWYNPNGKLQIEHLAKQIINILFYGLVTENAKKIDQIID